MYHFNSMILKMKTKIFFSACMALGALSLSSCGDSFLESQPASSVPTDGYYNTAAHIEEAATAAYAPATWYDYFAGWAPLFLVTDVQGDDLYPGGGSVADQAEIHLASQYKQSPTMTFSGAWSASYSGVNRANHLIEDATNATSLDEATRQQFIDEGVTIRSFYYLILWKFWGNVPYYADNLKYPYISKQFKADEVYEAVVKDLEGVLDHNSLPMRETNARAGHATRAFAEMMYADFVMYQNDKNRYQKALDYMENIINSGKYHLMSNFGSIFEAKNEWCDESIFEIDYYNEGSKRDWGSANAPGGTVVPSLIGVDGLNYHGGTQEFATGGWGFCDVSKEAYDAYEPNDQRRDGGILCMDKYIADEAKKGITVTYNGRYQNTGLFLKKYLGRPGENANSQASDLGWNKNMRVYRYAETLLNASELALRLGDQAKADKYLNEVRDRAGVEHVTATLDNLLEERRLEFVGEGKRYHDLIRFGKAEEVLKVGGGKCLNAQKTGYTVTAIPQRGDWTLNKKYLPIPQDEIDACTGSEYPLEQNPY